jgi:hypothetical protein
VSRSLFAAAAAATVLLAAAGCGPGDRAPRACSAVSPCGPGLVCRDELCTPSAPPTAALSSAASRSEYTNHVVRVDASPSADADADAEDAIATYRWSVVALPPTRCAADVRSDDTSLLEVLFPCPGEFEVRVVVVDSTGLASEPATTRISVVAAPAHDPGEPVPVDGTPTVTTGELFEVPHRCAGTPLRCTPWTDAGEASVRLQALAASPDGSQLEYRWTCARLDGVPVTIKLTNEWSPTPLFTAETAGERIAGDYQCTVVVADGRGRTANAYQWVRIGNRPPVIEIERPGPLLIPHRREGAQYVASGSSPRVLLVSDPDGDPFTANGFAASQTGIATRARFEIGSPAATVAFLVTVPEDLPHDLIGPTVSRRISYSATDVNGATGSNGWDVVVDNRPPRVGWAGGRLTTSHRHVDGAFVAEASFGTFVDDDGDPIALGTSHPICSVAEELGDATRVTCRLASAVGTLAQFATTHAFEVRGSDPWTTTGDPVELTIGNAPPRVVTSAVSVPTSATQGACCTYDFELNRCLRYSWTFGGGSAAPTVQVADDDGDPLQLTTVATVNVTATSTTVACAGGACPLGLRFEPASEACRLARPYGSGTATVIVTDGVGSSAATAIAATGG